VVDVAGCSQNHLFHRLFLRSSIFKMKALN